MKICYHSESTFFPSSSSAYRGKCCYYQSEPFITYLFCMIQQPCCQCTMNISDGQISAGHISDGLISDGLLSDRHTSNKFILIPTRKLYVTVGPRRSHFLTVICTFFKLSYSISSHFFLIVLALRSSRNFCEFTELRKSCKIRKNSKIQ